MSTMNPLPPQAYSKDTLVKAYAWVQNQPENIKELATTPEILVSLYQKAKLNGDACLERPSIQNFKSELKSLAGMIGEFDQSSQKQMATEFQSSIAQTPAPSQPPQQKINMTQVELDYRSIAMIREVKNELNLSSDNEALRLLISVGCKKLKSLG